MTIRFPKMHIAESVSNRILNIADGLPSAVTMPLPMSAPVPPDVPGQGEALDAQLQTPPGPAELPAGADGAVVSAALGGEPMIDAAVEQSLGVV